jgi:hypothetical protein
MPLLYSGSFRRLLSTVDPLWLSPLTPCRNGTAGQPAVGGGQLQPGPIIAPGSVSSAVGATLRLYAGSHIGLPVFR